MKTVFRALPRPVRRLVERVFYCAVSLLPARHRINILYYKSHGRFPDLQTPRKHSEKIQVRKLANKDLSKFVDKVLVKQFVASRCGKDIIIPTLYSGPTLPPHGERNWLLPYVIKTNHASGTNIFVTTDPNWTEIEQLLKSFMRHSLGRVSGELFYDYINKAVLVEPMIGSIHSLPTDFKFFCFDGNIESIQVDVDRLSGHSRVFYSPDWIKLPITHDKPLGPDQPQPVSLHRMSAIARELSRGFGFVRVDLYEVEGRVYFGELTLTPAAGYKRFQPATYDDYLGQRWAWPDTLPL